MRERPPPGRGLPGATALAGRVKTEALRLGFDLAGIAPAGRPARFDAYRQWVESGAAGEMAYMARHADLRADPAVLLPGALSVVMVAMNYNPGGPGADDRREERAGDRSGPAAAASGVVARYARGRDYHDLMRERLRGLLDFVRAETGGAVHGRAFVDTAPVLERDLAASAGLGWIGKNTCLLHPRLGSYFFLGGLLLDIALDPDLPRADRCGSCARCLDACPTGAFTAPHVLDARRCLSYHTIELRGGFPIEYREAAGDLLFGCDICQEVCPYNRRAPVTPEPDLSQGGASSGRLDLVEILSLDDAGFRRRFGKTALARTRRRGLVRNAAVALGNARRAEAVPALARALGEDPEAIVRGHAAWALGRIGGAAAREALELASKGEAEATVLEEIRSALERA